MKFENTVFISYRRELGGYQARSLFTKLNERGFDVYLDVEKEEAGEFKKYIKRQITSRAHFLLILTRGSLERIANLDDWLRFEINIAMKNKRNIIPLVFDGFEIEAEKRFLTPEINNLFDYQSIEFSYNYFDYAIDKLCGDKFLRKTIDVQIISIPVSYLRRQDVQIRKAANEQMVTEELKLQLDAFWSNPNIENAVVPEMLRYLLQDQIRKELLEKIAESNDWPYNEYASQFMERHIPQVVL